MTRLSKKLDDFISRPDIITLVCKKLEAIEKSVRDERVRLFDAFFMKNWHNLTERQQGILKLSYGFNGNDPLSLQEIGEIYDITRERVRRIEEQAIEKLINLK